MFDPTVADAHWKPRCPQGRRDRASVLCALLGRVAVRTVLLVRGSAFWMTIATPMRPTAAEIASAHNFECASWLLDYPVPRAADMRLEAGHLNRLRDGVTVRTRSGACG